MAVQEQGNRPGKEGKGCDVRCKSLALLIAIVFVLSFLSSADAKTKTKKRFRTPAQELAYCVDKMASRLDIDPLILLAIYKVESGWHPYAIGVRKGRKPIRSIYAKSKKQAIRIARRYLKKGYQLDLGIAQINYVNIRKWKIPLSYAFSICKSVRMSAIVLSDCMRKYGKTWKAVDCYNKGFHPYVRDSSRYVRLVKRQYRKLKRMYEQKTLARALTKKLRKGVY